MRAQRLYNSASTKISMSTCTNTNIIYTIAGIKNTIHITDIHTSQWYKYKITNATIAQIVKTQLSPVEAGKPTNKARTLAKIHRI